LKKGEKVLTTVVRGEGGPGGSIPLIQKGDCNDNSTFLMGGLLRNALHLPSSILGIRSSLNGKGEKRSKKGLS